MGAVASKESMDKRTLDLRLRGLGEVEVDRNEEDREWVEATLPRRVEEE